MNRYTYKAIGAFIVFIIMVLAENLNHKRAVRKRNKSAKK